MTINFSALLSVALLATAPLTAYAGFLCSGGVVSVGDSYADVEKKCGVPDHKKAVQVGNNLSPNPRYPGTVIMLWFYGPRNGAVTQIRFSADKVSNTVIYRPVGSNKDEVYRQNP